MRPLVQKYGGTSLGSIERIRAVAKRVIAAQKERPVVVVVSAMSGETNRLIELAHEVSSEPVSREFDLLLASGEQVSVGLLCLAINSLSSQRDLALPFLAYQLGIRTDGVFSKARIHAINTAPLDRCLKKGSIAVIAGFQGIDHENQITTLGRGGSDTSAVAVAAALDAECEILTDVDGVFTADPRVCADARKIDQISYEEMMELSSQGSKVLNIRSVELAAKEGVRLHVRSSFHSEEGTKVVDQTSETGSTLEPVEQVVVAGVASEDQQVKYTLQNLKDVPGVAATVFGTLAEKQITVDVIVQDCSSEGHLTIGFTVKEEDANQTRSVLKELGAQSDGAVGEMRVVEERGLAKVSIVGVGMVHHSGVAAKMFGTLAQEKINILLVSTSEIKVSCLIHGENLKNAVQALHREFGLSN